MIYYFPGAKTLSSRLLAAAGVLDLLDHPTARETSVGPGDTGGLLVSRGGELRYDPDRQVWLKRDPAGRAGWGFGAHSSSMPRLRT
jgi:hypothetical protein